MDKKGVALWMNNSNGKTFATNPLQAGTGDSWKHRGSIEGDKISLHSALPLNCLAVKELTGSGRHFGSATARAHGKTFRRRLTLSDADQKHQTRLAANERKRTRIEQADA